MRSVGSLLGLPPHGMPSTIEALQAYVADICERLTVTHEAREIAAALFHSNALTWAVMRPIRALTAGLLPSPLRSQFALDWGEKRQAALSGVCKASRVLLPMLPQHLKAPPWFLLPH